MIDLQEMDIRMKRTWIQYIYEERDISFNKLANAWCSNVKQNAGTIVGPILSWNSLCGETDIWKEIAGSMNEWYKILFLL